MDYAFSRAQAYQAVILHTLSEELLHPVTNNYPLAMATIVNKPLVCYQIEYLLRHGIHDIFITVEKKYAGKVDRYIKLYFKDINKDNSKHKTSIEIISF